MTSIPLEKNQLFKPEVTYSRWNMKYTEYRKSVEELRRDNRLGSRKCRPEMASARPPRAVERGSRRRDPSISI